MKRGVGLFIGLLMGLGLGLLIGWQLLPAPPEPTTPNTMRADYQEEYIRLVSVSYQVEKDLPRARERLAGLDAAQPTAPLIETTERWIARDRAAALIQPMARLARDLGVDTPAMTAYLTPETP